MLWSCQNYWSTSLQMWKTHIHQNWPHLYSEVRFETVSNVLYKLTVWLSVCWYCSWVNWDAAKVRTCPWKLDTWEIKRHLCYVLSTYKLFYTFTVSAKKQVRLISHPAHILYSFAVCCFGHSFPQSKWSCHTGGSKLAFYKSSIIDLHIRGGMYPIHSRASKTTCSTNSGAVSG